MSASHQHTSLASRELSWLTAVSWRLTRSCAPNAANCWHLHCAIGSRARSRV